MLKELIVQNRSRRRFEESSPISAAQLRDWVELARYAPSGSNRQPLKYMLAHQPERNTAVFDCLGWAGYLKDWAGPIEGERPAAYVVMLGDTTLATAFDTDAGIAAQSILLGAVEAGYGGCLLGSIQRDTLREALKIPERYQILLVIALGKPVERVVVEAMPADGDIRYWRDADGTHHVPKRGLDELILA